MIRRNPPLCRGGFLLIKVSAKTETVSSAAAKVSKTQKRRDFFIEMLLSHRTVFPIAIHKERRKKRRFGCTFSKKCSKSGCFHGISNQGLFSGILKKVSLHRSTRRQASSMTLSSNVPSCTAAMTAGIWVR